MKRFTNFPADNSIKRTETLFFCVCAGAFQNAREGREILNLSQHIF